MPFLNKDILVLYDLSRNTFHHQKALELAECENFLNIDLFDLFKLFESYVK